MDFMRAQIFLQYLFLLLFQGLLHILSLKKSTFAAATSFCYVTIMSCCKTQQLTLLIVQTLLKSCCLA